MSQPTGPKVEVPEELAAELEGGADAEAAPETNQEEAPEAEPEPESDAEPESLSEEPEEASPEDQIEALKDRHLRLAAEFDNFKRRALKERQDLLSYANENLVKELLPSVDNLERALEHARRDEGGEAAEKLLEGIELTHRSLMQVLDRFGVTVVETEGKAFDPKVHEAIRRIPSDEHKPGTVMEVLQRGYQLKDRLLRPALVAVASAPQEGSD
jgi:molecular chaperone GrpE